MGGGAVVGGTRNYVSLLSKLRGIVSGKRDRAQMTGNLVSLVIGVMIAGIVVMNVFIPVVTDAANNLSGTEATIAGLLPLFGVLLVLISLASPLMRRV